MPRSPAAASTWPRSRLPSSSRSRSPVPRIPVSATARRGSIPNCTVSRFRQTVSSPGFSAGLIGRMLALRSDSRPGAPYLNKADNHSGGGRLSRRAAGGPGEPPRGGDFADGAGGFAPARCGYSRRATGGSRVVLVAGAGGWRVVFVAGRGLAGGVAGSRGRAHGYAGRAGLSGAGPWLAGGGGWLRGAGRWLRGRYAAGVQRPTVRGTHGQRPAAAGLCHMPSPRAGTGRSTAIGSRGQVVPLPR